MRNYNIAVRPNIPIYKESKHIHPLLLLITLILILISFHRTYPHIPTMLFSTLLTTLALATAVSAIKVTAPSNSTGWTSSGAQIIEWDVSLSPTFSSFCSTLSAWLFGIIFPRKECGLSRDGLDGQSIMDMGRAMSTDLTFLLLTSAPLSVPSPMPLSVHSVGLPASLNLQLTPQAVSTDPSNFTIQLISPSAPNSPIELATNVETSSNSYTYTPESDLQVGDQWRINLVQERSDGGEQILAQSEYFEVEAGS
jgi:hypothetical protein